MDEITFESITKKEIALIKKEVKEFNTKIANILKGHKRIGATDTQSREMVSDYIKNKVEL